MSDKWRCKVTVTLHPWCHDIPRDEAVRAAEDNRPGPLPTLEQAIQQAFGFDEASVQRACDETKTWPAEVQSDAKQALSDLLEQGVPRLQALAEASRWGKRLFEARYPEMLPKTGSASSALEHENKGDDMTKSERQAAVYRADIEREAPAPPEASGLRTERVTLEITHDFPRHVSAMDWPYLVANYFHRPGESVRVVEDEAGVAKAKLCAAIKRAEAAELLHESQKDMMTHYVSRIEALNLRCKLRDRDFDEWKKAETRVAELEGEKAAAIRERDAAKSHAERSAVLIKSQAANVAYFRRDRDETRSERDAAIRERDELREERERTNDMHQSYRHTALARITSLESQLESVADRAAAAENALEAAPAASNAAGKSVGSELTLSWTAGRLQRLNDRVEVGEIEMPQGPPQAVHSATDGGRTPHVWGVVRALIDAAEAVRDFAGQPLVRNEDRYRSAVDDLGKAVAAAEALLVDPLSSVPASDAAGTDVVAWGVMVEREAEVLCVPFTVREAADHFVRLNCVNETMTVVPLCARPQPAPGWLTPEERSLLSSLADGTERRATDIEYMTKSGMTLGSGLPKASDCLSDAALLRSILARETPPEVVAPDQEFRSHSNALRDAEWLAAIAASGGKVNEVGRE